MKIRIILCRFGTFVLEYCTDAVDTSEPLLSYRKLLLRGHLSGLLWGILGGSGGWALKAEYFELVTLLFRVVISPSARLGPNDHEFEYLNTYIFCTY